LIRLNVVHGTKHRRTMDTGGPCADKRGAQEELKRSNRRIFASLPRASRHTIQSAAHERKRVPFYPTQHYQHHCSGKRVGVERAREGQGALLSMTRLCRTGRLLNWLACAARGRTEVFRREVRHPVPSPSGKRVVEAVEAAWGPQPEHFTRGLLLVRNATLVDCCSPRQGPGRDPSPRRASGRVSTAPVPQPAVFCGDAREAT
jgi:hypothetical protein